MASSSTLATTYRLVELQQEALKVQCKVDDFDQWGAPALDQEGYQKKEALQRATAHSQRGTNFWALVERTAATANGIIGQDDDVGDDDLEAGVNSIICHCESHMFDCVFRTTSGEVVRGFSHHIGSVFTLPAHRGQGLAKFFLTHVAQRMAKRGNALASVLYSDIGPTFYDRLGWRCHSSTMATLSLAAPKNAIAIQQVNTEDDDDSGNGSRLFLDDKLNALLAADNAHLITKIEDLAFAAGREIYATLPSRESMEWQFCLGVFYATIRGYTEIPSQCGLHLADDAFVIWCHNIKESTLYIVHARFPASQPLVVQQLLRAALVEAHKFNLESVAIWDPEAVLFDDLVTCAVDVAKSDREDSLSSLKVLARHDGGAANASPGTLPLWLNNEKMAWV